MTDKSGIGAGPGLAIAAAATVVVMGGGYFLAKGGAFGPEVKYMLERRLAVLGLVNMPAPLVPRASQPVLAPLEPEASDGSSEAVVQPAPVDPAVAAETELAMLSEEAAPTPERAAPGAEEGAADAGFELGAPVLDLARFETDGSGLIAGSAQAGVEVDVLLDGAVLERLVVEAGGEFVSFVTIEPSTEPRVISLVARHDGQEIFSEDSFILAPIAGAMLELAEAAETTQSEASEANEASEGSTESGTGGTGSAGTTGGATVIAQQDAPHQPAPGADAASVAAVAASDAAPSEAGDPETGASETGGSETGASDATAADATATDTTRSEAAAVAQAEAPDAELRVPVPGATPQASGAASDPAPQTGMTVETEAAEDAAKVAAAPSEIADSTPSAPDTPAVAATAAPELADSTTAPAPGGTAVAELALASRDAAVVADGSPAPQPDVAVAVLRANKDGVTLVQPAPPVAPELLDKIALDTISYTDAGEVQLAGRARPSALVRVYLDNSPVADLSADEGGRWSGNLSAIAPGIYTLRLDEIDPVEGKVLSRLETPFKREAPEVLQPALAGQRNAAPGQPAVQAITVQKGDTLWAISRERYGSGFLYVRVFEANRGDIRDPDLIYPGQIFTLPE